MPDNYFPVFDIKKMNIRMFPKIIITDFDKRFLSSGRRTQSPSAFSEAEPVEAGDN